MNIDIFLTKNKMPEPHQIVIVQGGIATWTGTVWLSYTGDSSHFITWPVLWWAPLLYDTDVLKHYPNLVC